MRATYTGDWVDGPVGDFVVATVGMAMWALRAVVAFLFASLSIGFLIGRAETLAIVLGLSAALVCPSKSRRFADNLWPKLGAGLVIGIAALTWHYTWNLRTYISAENARAAQSAAQAAQAKSVAERAAAVAATESARVQAVAHARQEAQSELMSASTALFQARATAPMTQDDIPRLAAIEEAARLRWEKAYAAAEGPNWREHQARLEGQAAAISARRTDKTLKKLADEKLAVDLAVKRGEVALGR